MTARVAQKLLVAWLISAAVTLAPVARAQSTAPAGAAQIAALAYGSLMTRAANAIRARNWPAAISAAKAAFSAAGSDAERLNAARLVASAHFRAGNFTRAEWWLRRALNNAQEGPGAQAVRQDFARVRQANPLSVRLVFSAAPNSNVNNGSSAQTVTIFNLPFILNPDAQALAGYEVSSSIDLRYRLAQSTNFSTDIGLLLHGRTYKLTRAAAAAAPAVKGSDFDFSVVEVLLEHSRNFEGVRGPTTFSISLGKNWYGGDPYTRYGRAALGQGFRLSPSATVDLSVGFERQISLTGGNIRTDIATLGTRLSHQLANRDALGTSIRLQQARSTDPSGESVAAQVGLSYGFGKLILGTRLSLNLTAEMRDFEFSIYDIAGRRDVTVAATAAAVLVNTTYFGFSPTVSLEANQTESSVDLFDRATLALRFGLVSAF